MNFAFWFFSAGTILSAFLCITRRSPVSSALWLITTLFNLAALFVLLDAHFLAAVQVLVYAGAIMVLFLFVIMLLNLGERDPGDRGGWWPNKIVGAAVGIGLVVELFVLRRAVPPATLVNPPGSAARALAAAAREPDLEKRWQALVRTPGLPQSRNYPCICGIGLDKGLI